MSTQLERIREAALANGGRQFREQQLATGERVFITTKDDNTMLSARPLADELECVVPGTNVFDWHRHEDRWASLVDLAAGQDSPVDPRSLNVREQGELQRLQCVVLRFAIGSVGRRVHGRLVDNGWRQDPAAIKVKLLVEGYFNRPDVHTRRQIEKAAGTMRGLGVDTMHPAIGTGPTKLSFREQYDRLTDGGKNDKLMNSMFGSQENLVKPSTEADAGDSLRQKENFPNGEYVKDVSSRRRTIRRYEIDGTRVVNNSPVEQPDPEAQDEIKLGADVIRPSVSELKRKTPPGETENLIELSVMTTGSQDEPFLASPDTAREAVARLNGLPSSPEAIGQSIVGTLAQQAKSLLTEEERAELRKQLEE